MTETYGLHNIRASIRLTNDRKKLAQELLDSNLLGVRLLDLQSRTQFDDRTRDSNFAVYRPANPTGSRVFIHGRDLFSNAAADMYFSSTINAGHMPYGQFGEKAKNKIRRALSPESLYERVDDYILPKSDAEYVKQELAKDGIDPSEVNQNNAYTTYNNLQREREQKGQFNASQHIDHTHLPDPIFKQRIKKYIMPLANQLMQEALAELEYKGQAAIADHYKHALDALLQTNNYDPEIVHNFSAGVATLTRGRLPKIEDVIKHGLEIRVEAVVRDLAEKVSNPYAPKFKAKEIEAAEALAKHMQPRLLRNALRTNTAIILTNETRLASFNDILGYTSEDWETAGGAYSGATPLQPHNPSTNNFIIIAGGNALDDFNYREVQRVGRHEFEHHRDLNQESNFTYYNRHYLEQAIKADRANLKTVHDLVKKAADGNHLKPAEHALLKKALPALKSQDGAEAIIEPYPYYVTLRRSLSMLNTFAERCSVFFGEQDARYTHYSTRSKQHHEIPAIIAELSAEFGSANTKGLLPQLTKMYREHRLNNPGLRDDSQGMLR
ncbi:MAG: hypothetical protein ACK502_00330 [Alphaproteobacteria bacterium]